MNRAISCLIVAVFVLSIASGAYVVSHYVAGNAETYYEYDNYDITSEGPDCRTARWYFLEFIIGIDDILNGICKVVGNDCMLIVWRTWLKNQYNITMY